MSFINRDVDGNEVRSDVLAYTPVPITAAGAGDVVVKNGAGVVVFVHNASAGVGVTLKDGNKQVWPTLTGVDEDDFSLFPLQFGTGIVLGFSGAGTAYIAFR